MHEKIHMMYFKWNKSCKTEQYMDCEFIFWQKCEYVHCICIEHITLVIVGNCKDDWEEESFMF